MKKNPCVASGQQPIQYSQPSVIFAFYNGVSRPMADTLRAMGVNVRGDIVAVNAEEGGAEEEEEEEEAGTEREEIDGKEEGDSEGDDDDDDEEDDDDDDEDDVPFMKLVARLALIGPPGLKRTENRGSVVL